MTSPNPHKTAIIAVTEATLPEFLSSASDTAKSWIEAQNFTASPASAICIPDAQGKLDCVLAGVEAEPNIWSLSHVTNLAPEGDYYISADWPVETLQQMALGVLLAQYQFDRYKKKKSANINLELPEGSNHAEIQSLHDSICLSRDLVNTPANDMHPEALAREAKDLADSLGASYQEIIGDDLLQQNYPAIHAVGRAAKHAPRIVELHHGNPSHPKIALVGKGVCFDSGGLDVKPYSSMKLMKKDMGGAALILGLTKALIEADLPIQLSVYLPIVENSISADAFRPQDIISTRKGLTVEIGSTDAEGRLILCDALFEADQHKPELIIDAATLTGAARVALGTDLPALFSNDNKVAQKLQAISHEQHDPLWQLPLWEGYDQYIKSDIADLTNTANYRFAGATTAALFLQHFVKPQTPWMHIDTYAWNDGDRPGRPNGGEALALRSIYYYLKKYYGGRN